MRQLRNTVHLREGLDVDLLFTPHLYSYKERTGLTLEYSGKDHFELLSVYADLMYLAGMNAWELDGTGTPDTFPVTRADFHEWMMQDPAAFGRTVDLSVEAMTGKPLKEYVQEAEATQGEDGKKKPWGCITRRSNRSSSAAADARSGKRR